MKIRVVCGCVVVLVLVVVATVFVTIRVSQPNQIMIENKSQSLSVSADVGGMTSPVPDLVMALKKNGVVPVRNNQNRKGETGSIRTKVVLRKGRTSTEGLSE